MRIWTLWNENGEDMPWLVDACDEYTIDDNGDFPESYKTARDDHKGGDRRELMIDIQESAVRNLFATATVTAKKVEPVK